MEHLTVFMHAFCHMPVENLLKGPVMCHINLLFFQTKLLKNKLLAKYLISVTAALRSIGKREIEITVLYKCRQCELNIVLYDAVILKLLKSLMNIQFMTGVNAMLTYLILEMFS